MTRNRRELPHAIEAERSVLGAVLLEPEILGWLEVTDRCFYKPHHRVLWECFRDLEASGQPIDEITVESWLAREGRLEAVGGLPFISEIALHRGTAANVQSYADILHDRRVAREVVFAAGELSKRAYDGEEGEELIGEAARRFSEIDLGERIPDASMGNAVREEYRAILESLERPDSERVAIPTGFARFDEVIGGLPIGLPSLLGARPKLGKSSWAACVAGHAALCGVGVHVLSWEDKRRGKGGSWTLRDLAREARVDSERLRKRSLTREELARVAEATERLKDRRRYWVDNAHGWSAERAARRVRAARREIQTELVIVDYLQLIRGDRRRNQSRDEELGEILGVFSDLAYKDELAVLILSQFNRDMVKGDKPRPPRMDDFRESGNIEQVGKLCMALWKPPAAPIDDAPWIETPGELIHLRILANTFGKAETKIDLRFEGEFCNFY